MAATRIRSLGVVNFDMAWRLVGIIREVSMFKRVVTQFEIYAIGLVPW
ncbi:MAG TPA: hypothetical protein VN643_21185 [Pyrinomonadaceae bacterium]|nr:hypothetical protein [Pyrinomonadaceae bacterium]